MGSSNVKLIMLIICKSCELSVFKRRYIKLQCVVIKLAKTIIDLNLINPYTLKIDDSSSLQFKTINLIP